MYIQNFLAGVTQLRLLTGPAGLKEQILIREQLSGRVGYETVVIGLYRRSEDAFHYQSKIKRTTKGLKGYEKDVKQN